MKDRGLVELKIRGLLYGGRGGRTPQGTQLWRGLIKNRGRGRVPTGSQGGGARGQGGGERGATVVGLGG